MAIRATRVGISRKNIDAKYCYVPNAAASSSVKDDEKKSVIFASFELDAVETEWDSESIKLSFDNPALFRISNFFWISGHNSSSAVPAEKKRTFIAIRISG